ncbi:MAG: hypothetical protein ACYDH9_10700 [Limisphaerales bacterium]
METTLSRGHASTMSFTDFFQAATGNSPYDYQSTCGQYQTRFKRTGQFWSLEGDEALMCLETFRRNQRWHLLFPHSNKCDPSKN